jgi:hypothetical protein
MKSRPQGRVFCFRVFRCTFKRPRLNDFFKGASTLPVGVSVDAYRWIGSSEGRLNLRNRVKKCHCKEQQGY